jgi:oxygen-independent coproporphyrinogen-3 oxidase
MAATSLYVHVPFCVVKCGYCDFHSIVPKDEAALDVFLAGLELELALARPPRAPCSVFFGGGTPTFLDARRFARLLEIVGRAVDLGACPEVTLEANPESVTLEKARLARDHGVGRVSLGAQSFGARHLRFLDRAHDAAQTARAVATMREAGFTNLSLDLMFGLPGQTAAEWDRDLDVALAHEPDHLSCYNLTFEPGTRLHRDLVQGRVTPNEDAFDLALFERTRARLQAAGFTAYEISNFAGRGGPCRHNDHYWLQGDYLGVGPGASSHRAGVRWTNLKPLDAWAGSLRRGLAPVASAETLTRRQRAAEALWLGLRRTDGVDLDAVGQRLPAPVREWFAAALERQVAAGAVVLRGANLRLTERGLRFADAVAQAFLAA